MSNKHLVKDFRGIVLVRLSLCSNSGAHLKPHLRTRMEGLILSKYHQQHEDHRLNPSLNTRMCAAVVEGVIQIDATLLNSGADICLVSSAI